MHCVIGGVNDLPTLLTGEGGASMETMRGRLALLDTQGAGLAERRSTICTGGPSLASRSWPTLHTDNWQLATDNFPVGLRSLRDLGPPYSLFHLAPHRLALTGPCQYISVLHSYRHYPSFRGRVKRRVPSHNGDAASIKRFSALFVLRMGCDTKRKAPARAPRWRFALSVPFRS